MLVIYRILLLLAMMVKTSQDKFDCSFEKPPLLNKTMCQFTYSGNSIMNRWTLHSGRTNTTDTGPYNDHTFGDSRGHYLYFEASGRNPVSDLRYNSNDDSVWIKDMPAFNGSRCMMFWLHMYHNTSVEYILGEFHIAQVTNNVKTVLYKITEFLPLNAWMLQSVDIPSSPEIYHLQFYGRRVDFHADRAIDDVQFYPVNCSRVNAWKSQWSNWGAYGTCSATCQSNVFTAPTQIRTRTCNGGIFGTMCNRSVIDRRDCNVGVACPGNLTLWSSYGACSATCQASLQAPTQKRTRTCVGATFGGNCSGSLLVQNTDCNVKVPCPDNKQDNKKTVIVSIISIVATLIIVIIIAIILKCKGIIACNIKRQDSKQSENDVYDDVAEPATPYYEDVKIQDITPSNYAKVEKTIKNSNVYENINQKGKNVIANTNI